MIIVQGDVLLRPYGGKVPRRKAEVTSPQYGGTVLAHGETTGYAHAVVGDAHRVIAATATSPRLLVVEAAEALLRHSCGAIGAPEKHPAQTIPARTVWEIVTQREDSDFGVRAVMD